jgi:hypothetical protein
VHGIRFIGEETNLRENSMALVYFVEDKLANGRLKETTSFRGCNSFHYP